LDGDARKCRLLSWTTIAVLTFCIVASAENQFESNWDLNVQNFAQVRYHWDLMDEDFQRDWALRRFKLMFDALYNKALKADLQLLYKTNNTSGTDDQIYVQEVHLDYSFSSTLNLKVGQFKPPFGWERFQRSFLMPCAERAQMIDRLIPNGSLGTSLTRDYGVQVSGTLTPSLRYEWALMTGNGANNPLTLKNAPLLVGRLTYQAPINVSIIKEPLHLQLQAAQAVRWDEDSDFSGQLPDADDSFADFRGTDLRWNIAASLKRANTRLSVEVLYVKFDPADPGTNILDAYGYFAQIDHRQGSKFEGVIRYERFDPDVKVTDDSDLVRWTFGVNYYFDRRGGRLMLDYVHNREEVDEVRNDQIIQQLQVFLVGKS
jgi:hypothetical protein